MKWMMAFLLSVIGWGGLAAMPTLLQDVVNESGRPVIPFKLYRLENGLSVVIHPDQRRPIVHVEMIYRVGSSHEAVGKSGFAHLFEHMMFQGSKHVPANEHMRIIDEIGGKLNGATGRDLTFFYQTVPAHHLETALWLESDRMGYFLEGLNQDKFDIQRNVVKSERFQRYENQPYGLVYEGISKQLYPHPHPYHWLPIGRINDLEQATVDDVRQFFKTWYIPNNATLVISGAVDPLQTIQLVNRYFADIPSGNPVPIRVAPVVELSRSMVITTEDSKITVPKVWIVFPTVPAFHPDEPYLDALAHVLSFGASSRFYPLVKQKRALSIDAYHITAALSGEFYIEITPHDGVNMNDLIRTVESILDGLRMVPVDSAELDRFKRRYEMRMADTFQELGSVARLLGTYFYLTGTPHYYPIEYASHRQLITSNMELVAQKYLFNKPRIYMGAYPKGRSDLNPFVVSPIQESALIQGGGSGDGMILNRSQRPIIAQGVTVSILPIWKVTQDDVLMVGQTVEGESLVSIRIGFRGGQGLATQLGYDAGSVMALVRLLNQDTQLHTAEALAAQLDSLGASVAIDAGTDEVLVTIRCLKSVLAEVMPLVFERLLTPAMKQDDLSRIQDEMNKELRLLASDPDQVASMAMAQAIYGQGHPLGQSILGVGSRQSSISLASLMSLQPHLLNRSQMKIVMAGGISTADMGLFESVRLFPKEGPTLNTEWVRPTRSVGTVVVVNMPDLPQSEVRVGFVGPAWDGLGDFLKLQWLNLPIGGLFNSRINLKLREEKAMTYGANSYWLANRYPGHFEVATSIKTEMTAEAIKEIISILRVVAETGPTETELLMIQSSMKDRDALRVETLDQQVSLLHRMTSYGLPDDYLKLRQDALKSLTRADLVALGQRYMNEIPVVVVVGDYQKIAGDLAALGMNIQVKEVREIVGEIGSPTP